MITAVAAVVLTAAGAAADSFTLTVVAQTNSTITFSYPQQPGYGYLYSANGVVVSRTNDPTRVQVKFSKVNSYEVAAIVKGTTGSYPVTPPPATTYTSSVSDGDTVVQGTTWTATVTPQPDAVQFWADGSMLGQDSTSPYTQTLNVPVGTHDLGLCSVTALERTCFGTGGVVASITVTSSNPPPPGASLYIAPSGSDTATCSQSMPCRSLNRAYQVASCGAVVSVAGGTYPSQTISSNGALANCTQRIVFQGEPGASFGTVGINYPASHVELRNLAINPFIDVGYQNPGSSCGNNPARDIKLVNIDVQSFHIGCVDGLDWQGGDVGPSNSDTVEHPYINDATGYIPKNIVLSGIYFHDAIQGSSGTHTECLLVVAADGLTVERSTFSNCQSTGPLYITVINLAGAQATCRGIVVQNNWFFGNGSQAAHFENDCDILVRYNSFSAGAFPYLLPYNNHPGGSQRTVTLVGNYGTAPVFEGNGSCPSPPSNFVFSYNVFVGTTCAGTGNVSVSSTNFVNPASDLHLLSGANAVDRGTTGNYPADDFDGQARYMGSAPDAGADER
jgi:hypothetical protein